MPSPETLSSLPPFQLSQTKVNEFPISDVTDETVIDFPLVPPKH